MLVRKALLQDASNIYDLVNSLSGDGTLLKRAFAEICENIRDFTVAESDGGVFLGCGALHLYGPHLCRGALDRGASRRPRARARAANSERAALKRPRSTAFSPCACSRASPTSFSSMDFAPSKTSRAARQDLQGLPELPAPPSLRRSGHGARTHSAHVDSRSAP